MNIYDVDRANFRKIRLDHRINQQDIAKRAHVSKATVCHYESHNTGRLGSHVEIRKDNEKMILRALVDMINEGFKSIDVRGGKLMGSVAGTGMSTSPALREGKVNLPLSGEDDEHLIFIDNIRKWLMANNITIKEFCKFVGTNKRILEIDFNRGKPVSKLLKKKIFDATGWRYEDILSGKINEGGEKMEDLDVKVGDELSTVGEVFDKLDKKTKDYVYKEVDDAINKTLTEEEERYLKQDHKAALETWEKNLGIKPVNIFDVNEVIKQQAEIITSLALDGATKLELESAIIDSMNAIRNAVDYSNYEVRNKKYSYFPESDDCVLSYELVKKFSRRISKEEFMEGISDAKTEKS